MADIWKRILKVLKDFCIFTSMHGFIHIAEKRRSLLERILWLLVTAAAIWGAVDISLGQVQRFNDNPTVVALDKDYRSWEFNLPAITVCEESRVAPSKLAGAIAKFWNITQDNDKYEYYSKFAKTVANSNVLNLKGFQEFGDDDALNVDMMSLALEMAPDDLLCKPFWSIGSKVNAFWVPVITEAGFCFSINSLAIGDVVIRTSDLNKTTSYPLKCIYASMSCFVLLECSVNSTVFVHSPYDMMDIMTFHAEMFLSLKRESLLSITETTSGKGVKDLAPSRRACRYTDEPTMNRKKVYSTNSCRLECRSKLAIKLCGCKPFYYFYEEGPTCTPKGMACLSTHAATLTNNAGTRCECSQQCEDSTFQEISMSSVTWTTSAFKNQFDWKLSVQAPRTRYIREIIFHFQDLVGYKSNTCDTHFSLTVSFGGAAGLFVGASFISFVEIFYFVLVRILRICLPEDTTKVEEDEKNHPKMSYETRRIEELTNVLERQNLYNDRLYYYKKH